MPVSPESRKMSPPNARKVAMLAAGIRGVDIARQVGVSGSWVSLVVSGKVLRGPGAQRVQNALASRLGRPVQDLWPELLEVA